MGFINKAIVLDWEATGLPREIGNQNWDHGPQGIEIGAIFVEDLMGECRIGWEFQTRVRFMQSQFHKLNWDPMAERIHGIGKSELTKANTPSTVSDHFTSFVSKSYAKGEPILLCGQNPMYDRYYLNQLYWMAGREPPRLHSRMIDTFSLGIGIWGHQTGNDLFEHVTKTKRTLHSALGDARSSYEVLKLSIQQTSGNKIGFRNEHILSGAK